VSVTIAQLSNLNVKAMKLRTILTAALLTGTAIGAHALELACDAPRYIIGEETPGHDKIQSISVNYNAGRWQIVHHFISGYSIDRANQYAITDTSSNLPAWEGWHHKWPNLKMDGDIVRDSDATYTYRERLTKDNQTVLYWSADCSRRRPRPSTIRRL
jgi:hypothetical protein